VLTCIAPADNKIAISKNGCGEYSAAIEAGESSAV